MEKYILSHDIGTSSDKAVLVDYGGRVIATFTEKYPTFYPQPSWVEQDPNDYWKAVVTTTNRILNDNNIDGQAVGGIVFSTQAQGVIPMDEFGNNLYNNITWVDGRAEKQAQSIMKKVGGKHVFKLLTGTEIMGKDCIAKIIWLKEQHPEIYNNTKYILDVNGYLKYKCTGKMVAELSGASSYGLDLKKKEWLSVMSLVGIDINKLPPIVKSHDLVGNLTEEAAKELGLSTMVPCFGGCDDVQAAAVGSGMCGDGDVHIYLGTSAWVAGISSNATKFKHGAAAIQSADPKMRLVAGITESAGANIEWIRDQFFKSEKEEYGAKIFEFMDEIIRDIPVGSNHLICTPWMLGERCPVSTTTTRATMFNISMEHTREHMMRAVYEGIGYNLRWILENFNNDYNFNTNELRVLGGGGLDDAWMQIIADITGSKVDVVRNPRNAGAVGGAAVALIGLKVLENFESAKAFVVLEKSYIPNVNNQKIYNKLFADYKSIYKALSKPYIEANLKRFQGDKL